MKAGADDAVWVCRIVGCRGVHDHHGMLGNNHADVREGRPVGTLSLDDEAALRSEAPAKDQIAGPEAAAGGEVVKRDARGDFGGRCLLKSRKKPGRAIDELTLDVLMHEDGPCGHESGGCREESRRAGIHESGIRGRR